MCDEHADEGLAPDDRAACKRILHAHGVTFALLFGSASEGGMDPHSDIDLAVDIPEADPVDPAFNEEYFSLIGDLERGLGREIQAFPVESMSPRFARAAFERGDVLIDGDDRRDALAPDSATVDLSVETSIERVAAVADRLANRQATTSRDETTLGIDIPPDTANRFADITGCIEQNVERLRSFGQLSREAYLHPPAQDRRDAVERTFEKTNALVSEVAEALLKQIRGTAPADPVTRVTALAAEEVLDDDLAAELRAAFALESVIEHTYGPIVGETGDSEIGRADENGTEDGSECDQSGSDLGGVGDGPFIAFNDHVVYNALQTGVEPYAEFVVAVDAALRSDTLWSD